jgi:hypothetical protein
VNKTTILLFVVFSICSNAFALVDDFHLVSHDTLPYYSASLINSATETPVDITGNTVTCFMSNAETGQIKVNWLPATVTNYTLGEFEYRWGANDTILPGIYHIRFRFTAPSGKFFTVPTGGPARIIIEE